jgi:hypothetical protein
MVLILVFQVLHPQVEVMVEQDMTVQHQEEITVIQVVQVVAQVEKMEEATLEVVMILQQALLKEHQEALLLHLIMVAVAEVQLLLEQQHKVELVELVRELE